MTPYALRVALQLLGGYTVVIVALFLAALIRGWSWKRNRDRSARLHPQIQTALIDYAVRQRRPYTASRTHRGKPGRCLQGYSRFAGGPQRRARDRVCGLALDLSLVHNWREMIRARDPVKRRGAYSALALLCASEPVRRVAVEYIEKALDDPEHDVRLYAAQSIGQFGDLEQVERVFHIALEENLLGRALLAGPMRSHALDLCKKAIPDTLAGGNREHILSTLELAVAWERAIPLTGLHKLIDAGERDIRIQALRTAPLAIPEREDENAILRALTESDTEVAMAAAAAIVRRRRLEIRAPQPGAMPAERQYGAGAHGRGRIAGAAAEGRRHAGGTLHQPR